MSEAEKEAVKRSAESEDDSDDDFVGPSIADAVPQKKKKVLEYEHVYLENIPTGINYEKSFMHRDVVSQVLVTNTDFVITASQDGHIKFWKKQEVGIEFVKHFRAHLGVINAMTANSNGSLLATLGSDKAIKVFDVINFDMINMLKLDYVPSVASWVHKPGDAINVLAVVEEDSNVIRMYDGKSSSEEIKSLKIHQKRVEVMTYCAQHDIAISADQGGMVEYFSGLAQDFGFPRAAKFDSKLDTDLYEFAKNKTYVVNMTISHNGDLVAMMGEDRKIRMFRLLTGKMVFVIDESIQHYNQLQNVKQVLPPMEFGKKVSVEKEISRTGVYKNNNIIFDESDNFILYSSLLGIKVVNIVTKSVSRLLAQRENLRTVNIGLFQGRPKSTSCTAHTAEREASDNPSLADTGTDPTLFTTSYKKNRFYLFTNRSSKDTSTVDNDRDVFNEKPSKEDIIAASEEKGPPRLYQNATIHTTMGDIHLDLFPRECPKTVENFCVHARNGYYNGHIFHRVIKQFMIQTGDPLGTGTGGESIWGGEFEDEFSPKLRHDRPYTLSMANAGPNTNGSQFFVTVVPTPWLDNKHTVFGRVVRGMEAVQSICNMKTHPKTEKPYDEMRGRKRGKEKDVWDVEGGYMGVKKQKLLDQFSKDAGEEVSEGNIFSGVAIFVNGWTNPTSDELKRIMMTHGGVFHHYKNSRTTHLIASNLPDVKVRQLKGDEKIVKPEWITESVAAGKLLDYSQFLLFFNQDKNQQKISFKPVDSNGQQQDNSLKEINDSKWIAKDATDTKFLGEYFSNSRLHHISTMGANAKDYVSSLRSEHNGVFPARDVLEDISNTARDVVAKTIMHIDMDCFFVSVGLRSRPELAGRPVVVTHAKGNKPSHGLEEDRAAAERRRAELAQYQERRDRRAGVKVDGEKRTENWKLDNIDGTSSMAEIASCSYEARSKGVRNGMFLGPALKLCPDLVPIPYDFEGYEAVSRTLYDTVASYTMEIMAVSCDEMFVDLTGLCRDLRMDPLLFVSRLREEIRSKTDCNCSVGLGPNILLSRLATKKAKPNGQFLLREEDSADLLAPLKVSELPGVGRSMEQKLGNLGVSLVSHLSGLTLSKLQQEFGNKTGNNLYNMARGRDERKLELDHVRKTVSVEVNYGIRFKNWEEAERFLKQLSEEVSNRMKKLNVIGKNITLKLMVRAKDAPEETAKFNGHGVCDNKTKSVQLHSATDNPEIVLKEVLNLVKATADTIPNDLRGVGITISKLEKKVNNTKSPGSSIMKFVKMKTKSDPKTSSPESIAGPSTLKAPVPNNLTSSDSRQVDKGEFAGSGKEVNLEVLNELPPEIRTEIEAEYRIAPSTSRAALNGSQLSKAVHSTEDDNSNSCDISFSKLDQEVLSELPPELQHEINSHFSRRDGPGDNTTGTRTAFSALMTGNSPKKDIKPRRGRKKGSKNKTKEVKSPGKLGARPVSHFLNQDGGTIDIDVLNALPEDLKQEVEAQMGGVKKEKKKSKESKDKKKRFGEEYVPSLMGRSGIEEIRPLIKEWILSTEVPLADDMKLLEDFFSDLIKCGEVDLLRILIKCLHRNISKRNQPDLWKETWKSLVIKTQSVMKKTYRRPLLITEKF